ncbi:MAG: NAD(P)/FAD-dependent oxidoreductase [Chitinophagales bacterium]|nr:NAD(P)/FAD-dependent oxidoreductase [Chitinophagales bacterium]
MTTKSEYEIIIIGGGFSGIAAAVNLQKKDIHDFLIIERDEEIGGTWWRNSYPGAAVDVQSQLYSFSFEPYDWTRLFAFQPEILDYTRHVIDKYSIEKYTITNSSVDGLEYLDDEHKWKVKLEDGREYKSKIIINASGVLSQPSIPAFEGLENFTGKIMHTSRWDHSYDHKGKKVAVIGSGASAVQTCPAIADDVEQLYIFQRNAHWILPRPDRVLNSIERKINRGSSFIYSLYRSFVYWFLEVRVLAFSKIPSAMKIGPQRMAMRFIKKEIEDEELRALLIPDYTIGCKRILLSSDYYKTLVKDNVTLIAGDNGIKKFHENSIETTDGEIIEIDCVVLATGFKASENNIVYEVKGRDGVTLNETWENGAHAYLGTTVPSFPNFFLLAGPNTGTGHTSAIFMIEAQLEYIMKAISKLNSNGCKSIEVKQQTEERFNKWLKKELKNTVWQSGGCRSWYQNSKGDNTVIWPDYTFRFLSKCKNFKESDHLIS